MISAKLEEGFRSYFALITYVSGEVFVANGGQRTFCGFWMFLQFIATTGACF